MSNEYTLSILKPDAVARNITGKVNAIIEDAGITIVAQKMLHLSEKEAKEFYIIHKDRPFFASLVQFMTQGPVIVQVLSGDNVVAKYRQVMGATNPEQAEEGTIRKLFAESIEANTVHGSDSLENAKNEIAFFFSAREIVR
ncbi:MAG: nucleoside-diphosphate kinase [Rickettsiaceae bacterium]|nr:nucleoside-diphosphate kinase [Rickettsiaceae bacterium]